MSRKEITRIWLLIWACLAISLPHSGQGNSLPVAKDLGAHGVTQAELNVLDSMMLQAIESGIISGCSFLVAHEGEIVYKKAHGAFTTDEQVLLASVSKPFAASTIMTLVDQGRLDLDAPVENYLPEFHGIELEGTGQPASPLFTTRHLLAHCAGFWGNKNISAEKMDLIRNPSRTLEDAVLGMAQYDLISHPNTAYTYSGSGYCVAGRVAEIALGGQSFEQICQENLFAPLGMDRTSFNPTPSRPFILVGGSLNSTLDDMAVFAQMQLNGGIYNGTRILSEASVKEMRRKQIPEPERNRAYGLGWFRYKPDENGLATHVVHGGATGTAFELNWKRQTVTAFLVRSDGPTVADLKNGLNDIIEELFPPLDNMPVSFFTGRSL